MNRFRTRGIGKYYGSCKWEYRDSSGTLLNSYDHASEMIDLESMSDVVTERYHQRVERGDIINNPLYVVQDSKTCTSGNTAVYTNPDYLGQTSTYKSGPWTIQWEGLVNYGDLDSKRDAFNATLQDAIAIAKQKALANIDQTPYALLEDVAEFRSTMKTIGNPLHSAEVASRRFQRKFQNRKGFYLKKGRLARAEAVAKAAADAWLSSRYEWRPILITLGNALDGFSRIHTRPKRMKARGVVKNSFSYAGTYFNSPPTVTMVGSGSAEYAIKAWIYYQMAQSHDYRDWDFGVRLKDVPKTAWALVSRSFVYDKFLDITSSIEGLTNMLDPRLTILSAGVNIERVDIDYRQGQWAPGNGWVGPYLDGGVSTHKVRTFSRTPWLPTYPDLLPTFTGDQALSDLSNVLDVLSLVTKNLRLR